jgi:hypothetical protein
MYGRRDSAVLMTALVLLTLAVTRGQPTSDAPVSPEKAASDQSAADINSVNPTATTFSRSYNGSAESMKKVRMHAVIFRNNYLIS